MPRKPMSKRYTGVLAKPRKPWGPLPFLNTDQELSRRQAIDAQVLADRLVAVLQHYGIATDDPQAILRLLHALLIDHVPGFQVARGRGREPFWTVHRNVELVFDVQRIIDAGKHRALLALDLASAPTGALPLLPLPKARINNGPVPYVTLVFNALTEAGKPLPTSKIVEYVGAHRELADLEKAKVNITSSLSKDERFKSVEWANGRAWWLVGKPVPKTDMEKLLE
jgi:hypothetical protein